MNFNEYYSELLDSFYQSDDKRIKNLMQTNPSIILIKPRLIDFKYVNMKFSRYQKMLKQGFQWQNVATYKAIEDTDKINWLVKNNYFELSHELYEVLDSAESLNYVFQNHYEFIRCRISLDDFVLEKIKAIDYKIYKKLQNMNIIQRTTL